MSLFDLLQLITSNIWVYGIPFILVLSLLVFVHEWGHYIVAKMCGVHVEVFSIGFGKELFGVTDKSGTRWQFSAIPLGGYVKMFGDSDPASAGHDEDVDDGEQRRPMTAEERKSAFFAKPVWKRAAIVFAGPAINFLFAVILFIGLYASVGKPVTPPVATGIVEGGAAAKAGFKPHDRVVAINGQHINRFEQIRRAVMITIDEKLEFTVLRDGQEMTLTAEPEIVETEDHFGFEHSYGFLGVIGPNNGINVKSIQEIDGIETGGDLAENRALLAERMGQTFRIKIDNGASAQTLTVQPKADFNEALLELAAATGRQTGADEQGTKGKQPGVLFIASGETEKVVRFSLIESVGAAMRETWDITAGTMTALGQIITGARSATELGGIIRIGAIAGDMAQAGLIALISFTAILSINLGLINLFPIPMLDGGHLVFYAVEALKGSPISEQIQEYAFRLGLVILVGIMLFANLNDIVQIVS